jgi:hypothetical protein
LVKTGLLFAASIQKKRMDAFKIAFWKTPVSKDDSALEVFEANLIHATVTRTTHNDANRYAIELEDPNLRKIYGNLVLSKTSDGRWNVISSLNGVEDIFVQLVAAIENAEATLTQNDPTINDQ